MSPSPIAPASVATPRRKENAQTACNEVREMRRRVEETGSPLYSRQHREMYDFPLLHWCRNRRVLEVGVGYGYGIERLAKSAREVVGIDILKENVAHASEARDLPNAAYVLADIRTWEAEPESFDVAVMIDVIEHISDDRRALENIRRLLKPRGTLFVSTVWPRLADDGVPFNRCHCREYFPREFRTLVKSVFPDVILHAYPERNLIIQAQKES